ncbi:gamma-butyrobetaine hydroxylase-like domain-containing protein [Marinomonas algarum]|uniref:DUF971 domain-containing protein n=1 Tax=Marinomonas algarum TaxID=2883105 RepID=A0A9X1IN59_9GAMM|nr:DUF971 domain-containing protein [Marinomonas algarum]MCB5162318.1 DUF971 domain-containing protein [Marinomonas algarum]
MTTPTHIHYHKKSRELALTFSDGLTCRLSAEFLRVHSPSAEVRGHGQQVPILQYGKKEVAIQNIEGAGNYALKITFDDGHDTGLYSWKYLYNIGKNYNELWQIYLDRLEKAGQTRETSTIQIHQL